MYKCMHPSTCMYTCISMQYYACIRACCTLYVNSCLHAYRKYVHKPTWVLKSLDLWNQWIATNFHFGVRTYCANKTNQGQYDHQPSV